MKPSVENRYIWLGGSVVPLPDAKINVLSPTSQFGANVFEGIRCYWNEERQQLFAFRLEEHYKRLKRSIKMLRLEDRYSENEFRQALLDVVRANGYREDIAVRQTVFVDGFGTWTAKGPVNMFVAPIPKARTRIGERAGLRGCVSSWERISDRNLSPKVKVGANYINSRMAQMEALENGYDTAILMNSRGTVAEGPGSCFFMVRDGVLVTPPCTASILESITRDTVLTLAKDLPQIPAVEREIDRTELYICDEAFLCGSAMEIAPILQIDGYQVGAGRPGPVTSALSEAYLAAASGETPAYQRWLTPVYGQGE